MRLREKKRVAKIQVDYEFRSTYRTVVDVEDDDITEILTEWGFSAENPPSEQDIKNAIEQVLQEISDDGILDYTMDEETGWGDYEWLEETVIEPYPGIGKEVREEIPGQIALVVEEGMDQ
jgi:ribosome biogenesis GTPase A